MQAIDNHEYQSLPEQARQAQHDEAETLLFSNHSANLIEAWLDDSEDEVWKQGETQ